MSEYNDIIAPVNWATSDDVIKVLGVGGGGCNAVDYMYKQHIQGCTFVVCNTDAQALDACEVPNKIQLGAGLGAGTNPTLGRSTALNAEEEILTKVLDNNTRMLFITAGMGGGTGTGAAPVIAKMAKEKQILTVAVITLPFKKEGNKVMARAIDGIHELEKNVDSMIIVNNEKIYDVYSDELSQNAYLKVNDVLATAVKCILSITKKKGDINIDFMDVQTMMRNSGMALMGLGVGTGDNRLEDAVKNTFESPLLNDLDLQTANNLLLSITLGYNDQGLTMREEHELNDLIAKYVGPGKNFKYGLSWDKDPDFGDKVIITAIVTGFKLNNMLGVDLNQGSIIPINDDYVYTTDINFSEEVIRSSNDFFQGNRIGFNTPENKIKSIYNPEKIPVYLSEDPEIINDLKETPAIRRIKK